MANSATRFSKREAGGAAVLARRGLQVAQKRPATRNPENAKHALRGPARTPASYEMIESIDGNLLEFEFVVPLGRASAPFPAAPAARNGAANG